MGKSANFGHGNASVGSVGSSPLSVEPRSAVEKGGVFFAPAVKVLGSGMTAKRVFDISGALLALAFLAPLLIMLTLIVLVGQGRPILIRHRRIGRGGASFPCFKFRTMVRDADDVLGAHLARDMRARDEWNATRKLRNDPRITAIGAALRKSSVDELPQLLNILRGDMSFVGPRPIVQDEAVHYGAKFADYCRVRPGLTGLWQVSGRSDVSYASRVQLDVTYIQQRSFAKDLVIIAKTIPAVLRSTGSY
jgi:exopolysaccharide production protein ExoY